MMKNSIFRLIRILAVSLTLVSAGLTSAYSQGYENTPVSISKEKVKVNGKICYSHVVLERQTLFSISKAYNVSLDEIYKFNPTLKDTGLIKNSILIIPATDTEQEAVQPAQKQEVQPKAEKAVKEAPNKDEETKVAETKVEETKKKKRNTHVVKWYESIDDIAAKYGVSPEEIMAANNLTSRKLKSRMKLIIPESGEYAGIETADGNVEVPADSSAVENQGEEEMEKSALNGLWPFTKKDNVTASLLLPFKATGTSGSRSNMDFYSGVLLAVNDLGQSGISTDLNVYDIADGAITAAEEGLSKSDFAIGPVSTKDLTATLAATGAYPMVISPLDPKTESLALQHANFIQAPTPHKIQFDDLASWIKEDTREGDRVIMITEKGARPTELTMAMKQSIDSCGIAYKTFSYSILEGRDVLNPLKTLMSNTAGNRFVIVSESEAFVNDVVRNLNLLIHQKYEVILYSGSKIRSFDTIEVENFHKTNMHVSLNYYINYNDPAVKKFLLKYRALFNTEPTQFAFQGYDIASYFIDMCSKYGRDWLEMLEREERSMLQSTFKCRKEGQGGYINHGVRRIVYGKDWTITRIK